MFEPAICMSCGEGYQRNLRHRPSRFCSRKCQSRALYLRKQVEAGVVRVQRTCGQCSGPVSMEKRSDARFCSGDCRATWHYQAEGRRDRLRKYGITPAEFDALLAAQGGTCAIAGCDLAIDANGRALHVDHDHSCCPGRKSCRNCIRGLVCGRHNVGLGMFNDDPAALRAAADYLESRRLQAVAS